MPDDYLATTQTTGRVSVGGSATGEIETANDFDWFAVELVAGESYVIDLEGADSGGGTLDSTVLRGVYDARGQQRIAGTQTNDGGVGDDARLLFTAAETGTHYIAARGHGQATGTYTVRVAALAGDEAPVFAQASYTMELEENADGALFGIALAPVVATGPDNGAITYSIVAGDADRFVIDAETGVVVYVGTGEDPDSGPASYELTVRASDGALHSDVTVTVNVGDVEDYAILEQTVNESPQFTYASYAFELDENAAGDSDPVSLGVVQATDPEAGTLTYSIESGDPDGLFVIDSASGALSYQGPGEDYESGPTSHELTVRASDGTRFADATVTVNIGDVPEQEITGSPAGQTVSEPAGEDFSRNISTAGRIVVGDTATGNIGTRRDRDWFAVELEADREYRIDLRGSHTGDGTLRDPYLRGIHDAEGNLISGTTDDDGGVDLNSRMTFTPTETGTYYIAAGAFSGHGTYELEVRDISPQTAQQETVNGSPAFASASYAFALDENAAGDPVPVALGLVQATDPEDGTLIYSIESGDPDGLFAIDPMTGTLSYQGPGEDYESGTTRYELTVRASDGTGHSDVTVTVNVGDVQEAPAFGQDSYAFDLLENAAGDPLPLSLGQVEAEDPDNDQVTYSIESGDSGGLFSIDPVTGALSYRGAGEDYESGTTRYELTVRASDGTGHDDVTVTINVTDDPDDTDEEEFVSLGQGTSVSEPHGIDFPANTFTDGVVAVGGSATGRAGPDGYRDWVDGDFDWFAVTLEAGRTYRIDLEGSSTNAGTLWNPYLAGVFDAEGNRIFGMTDVNGGAHKNSRLDFTATENATHYVMAGGYLDAEGTYKLSVTDITDGVPDDLAAGTGTLGTVAVGGSARGKIEFSNDRDWFAVELEADKIYRIDLEGSWTGVATLRDPYLRGVYDANGDLIAGTTNDDSEGPNSRVYFTATENATYYVAAGGGWDSEGTYKLSVREIVDDYAAGTGTIGAVVVGGSTTGKIEPPNDRDWFAVMLEAGREYRIDLEGSSTDAGTLHDPYLRGVYDANGSLISGTAKDDGGVSNNSRMDFTATENAIYYVAAGADGSYRRGTYTLSVTDITDGVPDDYAAGTGTTGTVAVGGSSTGEIEYGYDRDWFAVPLEAEKTYRIDLEGSWTDAGTLSDPYLRGIHDANGVRIAGTTDDKGGTGENSRVDFTATENAIYYVAASADWALGSLEGTYRLSVTDITDGFPDDFEAGTGTTGVVAAGGSATGEIEHGYDRDWFAVELEADRSYRIDLEGKWTDAGTLRHSYLAGVYDANGDFIPGTRNRSGGTHYNSRVTFTATEAATYYVAAGSGGDSEGTYTLSVTEIVDDYAAGTGTGGTVEVGRPSTGEIEFEDDRDWFAVTLEAGKTYRVDLEGPSTGAGTLNDPHLRGIHDAAGDLITGTTDDNSGIGGNSRVDFTATANAIYYVAAGADGSNRRGTYTLSVTDITDGVPDDYAAGTGTTGTVAVGGSATGEIETPDDRDWFAVSLEAGKTYRIDLEGSWTGAGTLRDPYLRGVYDAAGDLISATTNDDGGAFRNSREFFTATANATYYLAAGAGGGEEGTYTLSVAEIADDYADETRTGGTVAVGGSSTGKIDYGDDRDWFAVELVAGREYRIDLEGSLSDAGTLGDPYLRGIHDANGDFITGTTNDDRDRAARDYNSRVDFTATENATYYVAAGGYRGAEGTYTLSVTDITDGVPDDFEAGTGTSGAVVVGGSSTGDIETPNDRDWFAVTLKAGKTYRIDLEAGRWTDAGTLHDPYLRGVYDANGDLIAGTTNDHGGVDHNSKVFFTATADATYYVAAGADGNHIGTYTLSVTEIPDDYAAGTDTTGTVAVDGSSTGEIEYRNDRDWFAVPLDANTTYRIDLEGSRTGAGTLSDPYLRGVYDANGDRISDTTDNNGGVGLNSRMDFTATADATYYVAAGGYRGAEGTYTLSVEEVM